jgi:ADP-ribose pyrophosphatase YjhB (NUDIX family)
MSRENGERRELNTTLSVVVLVSDFNSMNLLLVQDKESGKWSPPAGGLNWLESERRIETFAEGVERELREETGVEVDYMRLKSIVNLPGIERNHIGAVYIAQAGLGEERFSPEDLEEIGDVKFFSEDELIQLFGQIGTIRKPEFNRGLIAWWLRNAHRHSWDPYRGAEPLDQGRVLDERYLEEWLDKPTEELFKP